MDEPMRFKKLPPSRYVFASLCMGLGSMLLLNGCKDETIDNGGGDDVAYEPTDCDPIDPSVCALPWPSNLYLIEDDEQITGHSLQFGATTLPKGEKQISPEPWNGLDGYGVSTPMLFKAPNLDLSDLPSETNSRGSWDGEIGNAGLFKVEEDGSLSRVPFWIEQDLRETPDKALYYIRPAVVLEENTRYVVMLRNLQDTSGASIERSDAFDTLIQNKGKQDPELSGRQDRFNEVFDKLETIGVPREELYLAWDFNTISHEKLHGNLLAGRDLILNEIQKNGVRMYDLNIKVHQRDDASADNYNKLIRYEIRGNFDTPTIIKRVAGLDLFHKDENGNLALNGTEKRPFWVNIPYSAVGEDAEQAPLMQYGHGLMNEGGEIENGPQELIAEQFNYIYFAGNWTGMSIPDFGGIANALMDFSKFRTLADKMNQGILEFVVLAYAMQHEFFELDEIQALDEPIQADTDTIFYSGNSQGGIYGPTYMAISPVVNLGQMGVPGSNYNMLLQRSTAFDRYASIGYGTYDSDPTKWELALVAAQTLWDMTDSSSWYRHLMDDPNKHVLATPARGDYQVSPLTNLIMANTSPALKVMTGWGQDVTQWGLEETNYPHTGSGIVIYNLGHDWPAPGNNPPVEEDDGNDPHSLTRHIRELQEQVDHFLRSGGEIIDVCNGSCNFVPMSSQECAELEDAYPGTSSRGCWKLQ